ITLTQTLPRIETDLTIIGGGHIIDGGGTWGAISILGDVAVSIGNLTVENAGTHGVSVAQAEISLEHVTVTGSGGSGLSSSGDRDVTVTHSTFTDNGNIGVYVASGGDAQVEFTDVDAHGNPHG